MASPIAHSFAGSWTFLLFAARAKIRLAPPWRQYLPQLCVLVLLANLPDFDFLLQLATRTDLHREFSHSLAAAIVMALALSCVWRMTEGFWQSVILYFTAYASHLLIDFFTGTELGWTHTGSGIPLLWPWPKTDFSSPLILIYGVRHGSVSAILSMGNIWSAGYELLVFGAITIVLLVCWARYVLKRGKMSRRSESVNYLLQPDAADLK